MVEGALVVTFRTCCLGVWERPTAAAAAAEDDCVQLVLFVSNQKGCSCSSGQDSTAEPKSQTMKNTPLMRHTKTMHKMTERELPDDTSLHLQLLHS